MEKNDNVGACHSLNMADQLSQTLKTSALFMGACVSVAIILKLATALINKIH